MRVKAERKGKMGAVVVDQTVVHHFHISALPAILAQFDHDRFFHGLAGGHIHELLRHFGIVQNNLHQHFLAVL